MDYKDYTYVVWAPLVEKSMVSITLYIYITLRGRHQRLELWYIQVIPRQSRAWGGITEIYHTLPYSVFLLLM